MTQQTEALMVRLHYIPLFDVVTNLSSRKFVQLRKRLSKHNKREISFKISLSSYSFCDRYALQYWIFSAGVEQHVEANARADARLTERRRHLAQKARELELRKLKQAEKLKRQHEKRAKKERHAKRKRDYRNLRP